MKKGASPAKKGDTAQKIVVPVIVSKGQQVVDFAEYTPVFLNYKRM